MKKKLFDGLSGLAFWRKGSQAENTDRNHRFHQASDKAGPDKKGAGREAAEKHRKDWLFAGTDEEGTPVYLDRGRILRPSGSTNARVWLKHIPPRGAHSFVQALQYLKETGAEYSTFWYIEQLLEWDIERNQIADLVLLFFDRNDRLISEVQFHEKTFRPSGAEGVFSAMKGVLTDQETQPGPQPQAEPDQPNIDERIQTKLQEINTALQAFDSCKDAGNDREPPRN